MEVVASVVGSLAAESARILCGYSYSKIRYAFKFQSNLNSLNREMKILIDQKNQIKELVETSEEEGKLPTQLKEWLREVEGIEVEVNLMQSDMTSNEGNLCGSCLNCSLHYKLGKRVAEKLEEVNRLMKDCSFASGMEALNSQVKTVEYIPGPLIENQTEASKNLAKIMDLLNDDEVRRIGIWGMGGVGKTTLVKNLNNKLRESDSLKLPFDIVIWVTVSKEMDLKRVQTQIAGRLNLVVKSEESIESLAVKLYRRLGKVNKFLLILDDVWKTIDLESLGIPETEIATSSKIMLTSRSYDVCRQMKTDVEFRVGVLDHEEAWKLFTNNAGKVACLEHIKPFAEEVARECNGLPLAIITVGRAMRRKERIDMWKDALNELRRSKPYIEGIESEVYKPLKWSYDSLHGENIKTCFLYCSLFPEDFSIKESELVQCWMEEGLIDEELNYVDSVHRGNATIENLKDTCLLEDGIHEGTVKMHDVIRDVAIWIASSVEAGCKSLVRSGIGLSQISEVEMLKSSKTIAFMENKLTTLPDCVIRCPKTSTLLLQGNRLLERVPEQFLQGFRAMRVLNVSLSCIQSLPLSLSQMRELRALVLHDCIYLEEVPPLGGLRKLQVLDLCGTRIRELPKGIEELNNLRQLNLSKTRFLKTIQAGVVSRLSGLEVLDMRGSCYKWGVKGEVEEGQTVFEELGCLSRLIVVCIWLGSVPCLGSKDLIWIGRLRSFHIIVGSQFDISEPTKLDEGMVIFRNLDFSKKQVEWLFKNNKGLPGLKSLSIMNCQIQGPFRGYAAQHDLLPNLEELYINDSFNPECVRALVTPFGLRFCRLRLIKVTECPNLTYLIPHELIPYLVNLEEIMVRGCTKLEMLFQHSSGKTVVALGSVVPKLRILELAKLPELRTICRQNESWQSLERLLVFNCNLLTRLPLTTQNANTIKEIRGERGWWMALKWDDDDTEHSLLPYFNPIG